MSITDKVQHNQALLAANGATVRLVAYPDFPNLAIPDISKPDTSQQYDIGTVFEYNGKAWYYGYCKTAVAPNMGAKVYNTQDIANVAIAAAAAQYDTRIALTAGATDGLAHGGVFAKDYLKGGHVVCFPAAGATSTFTRGIIGSSALAATGTIYLDLDGPIPEALTTSGTAEATASPWKNMAPAGSTYLGTGFHPVCGVPACRLSATNYGWVQTWGFCWVSPHANVGVADSDKMAYFVGDGSFGQGYEIMPAGGTHYTGLEAQHGGWVMAHDKAGGQGAPFVYLMIAR